MALENKEFALVCYNGDGKTGNTNPLARGAIIEDTVNSLQLFKTDNFVVELDPNQVVPGKLRIKPQGELQKSWNNWQDVHFRELIRVQRTIELALIQTFALRTDNTPSQDKQLINFAGKQRPLINEAGDGNTGIYFDVIPRYNTQKESMKIANYEFYDRTYGKPFDYSQKVNVPNDVINTIANMVRDTLKNFNLAQIQLLDTYQVNLSEKFNPEKDCVGCIPSDHEPTGLARIEDPIGKRDFKVLLDSRDQREPGRTFLTTGVHYPHLRYWPDETMVLVGKVFHAFRNTIHELHGTNNFDFMSLMNLARTEGTHTHFHLIPRNMHLENGKEVGIEGKDGISEFSMNASVYQPIPKGKSEEIAAEYAKVFVDELNKVGVHVNWAPQQSNLTMTNV